MCKKNPLCTENAFWGICDCCQLIFWLIQLVSSCGILVKRSGEQFNVNKREKRFPWQWCDISYAERATDASWTYANLLRNVIIRQYFVFAAPNTEISFILPVCLLFSLQENISAYRFFIQGFISVLSAFFTPEDIILSLWQYNKVMMLQGGYWRLR